MACKQLFCAKDGTRHLKTGLIKYIFTFTFLKIYFEQMFSYTHTDIMHSNVINYMMSRFKDTIYSIKSFK